MKAVARPSLRVAARPLYVLVVDDSAVAREVLTGLLSSEDGIEVATAGDPIIAMEKMKRRRPDVIVLDLEMPRMDGLTFLRKIMREDPIPVLICSAVAGRGTDAAFRAMAEGAVDIIHKPKVGLRDFLYESAVTVVDAVRGASQARLDVRFLHRRPSRKSMPVVRREPARGSIVAIGASTGGPEAIRTVLDAMPADGPGVLVVQHMPQAFTKAFAERLNATSPMEVKEARAGDEVLAGRALVAPGNLHMRLVRKGARCIVDVADGPLMTRHRPSVDVLFRSVAEVAGPAAVGVLLTGMGEDGADGLMQMKRAGGATIAQDEQSSVVFGMPAKAIARGAADEILGLREIAGAILRRCEPPPRS
jgi:two-component system, chemotaxis family, protein-glutamate methylesterase/glutaminase